VTLNLHFQKPDKFQQPHPTARHGKIPEPSPFERFPESKHAFKRSTRGNLADLTREFLRDFIIADLLVKLSRDMDAADDRKELMEHCKSKLPSTITGCHGCANWGTSTTAPGKSWSALTVMRGQSSNFIKKSSEKSAC
jgi:hypothetical protein